MTNYSSSVPKFRNLTELSSYLERLEARVSGLEADNANLRHQLKQTQASRFKTERGLPDTALVSDSFFSRAFAVWGHYFIAQLIIGVPIFLCYLIVMFTVLSNSGY